MQTAQEALALFRTGHITLSKGRDGLPGAFNPELQQAFFGRQGADEPVNALGSIVRRGTGVGDKMAGLVAQATPMLALLDQLTQTYEAQARAADKQQRLSELMGRIQSIASEARIVSLNARVVAARAGEQGREFAVVASVLSNISEQIETLTQEAMARDR